MIKIHFLEPTDQIWRDWVAECERRQLHYNTCNPRPEADSKLYGKLKELIYLHPEGPFHGKCAYCEQFIATNQHGDIDHFRPKGAVKNKTGKPIKIIISGVEQNHPGYYWLTYDWRNLLPVCQLCNQPNKRRGSGATVGKRDYFPLTDESKRASLPGEEIHEQPLLINPVFEDPDEYMGLDKSGVLFGKDGEKGRGQACIETFGLYFKGLEDKRAKVYDDTFNLITALAALLLTSPNVEQIKEKIRRLEFIEAGCEEFSLAARLAIKDARQRLALLRAIL